MTVESAEELDGLRACGALVRQVFQLMKGAARPGIRTDALDRLAQDVFDRAGARSAPAHFYDFPGATCISVNEAVAHGIPGQRRLVAGDLVNIDVSAELNGFVADMGESFVVPGAEGPAVRAAEHICRSVRQGVWAAIRQVRAGRPLNLIGQTAERVATRRGYRIVENLGSHGVGRLLHEEPSYVPKHDPKERRRLEAGMVLTIEPFFTTGRPWVEEAPDGWTLLTAPGALTAQYEQTIVVRDGPAEVLTAA